MRITNCSPASRHFAYASSSGRTLNPGDTSADIPIQEIFNPSLKADLDANRARLRLSEKDKQFIAWVLAEDCREIVQAAPIPVPDKAAKKQKPLVKPEDVRKGSKIPVMDVPPRDAPKAIFIEPGKAKSLAELKQHNQAVKRPVPQANPPKGIPMADTMGSGTPDFGQTSMTKAESLQNARNITGGRI